MPETPLTKYYESTIQEGPCDTNECIAVLTTDRVDRDREVVVAAGGRLENFRANPVVMYGHAKGLPSEGEVGLPVARNLWVKPTRDGRGLVGKHAFDLDDAFSFRVCGKAKRGFLNTHSITFRPIKYGPPTKDEIAKRPDWGEAKTIYREWELIEYSIVAMPSNVDAVTLAKRGKTMPDEPVAAETTAETTPPDAETVAKSDDPGPSGGGTSSNPDGADNTSGSGSGKAARRAAEEMDGDDDEDDDDREPPPKRGDHVKCRAPHFKGCGVVQSVHKGEMVPDVDEDMYGSKDAPACRVKACKQKDGGCSPTAVHKAVLMGHVEKCDMGRPKRKAAPAPEPGWTEADKAAYKASLMADPGFKSRVDEAVKREFQAALGKTV
jgi:hypothetical protein